MKKTFIFLFTVIFIFNTSFELWAKDKLDILADTEINSVDKMNQYLKEELNSENAFNLFINDYSTVIRNKIDNRTEVTVFTYINKTKRNEKLFIYTNLNPSGIQMNEIKKSGIFYSVIQIPDEISFLIYSFKKETGDFFSDAHNPLVYCDRRCSSLIHLKPGYGAFVKVNDYESSDYTLIPKRTNLVYLPSEYFENTEKEFPVIYWFDGQNLWDYSLCPYGGWKVDTTMEKLFEENKSSSFIIAGVRNSNYRIQEYVGWSQGIRAEAQQWGMNTENFNDYAEEHAAMFVNDYITFIENNLRVKKDRENRYIAGSSYGAFLSAWLLEKYPELFCGAGLFSGGGYGFEELIQNNSYQNKKYKIYMDCGNGDDLERNFLVATKNMHEYLLNLGYAEGVDFIYREENGACHNEAEWAKRVPYFLEFISQ